MPSPFRRAFRFTRRTPGDIRDQVDEELGFHLDMRAEELARGGMSPADARAQARREFGDLDEARRSLRRMDAHAEARTRRADWLGGLRQDLRFAARTLARSPGFTAVAVLALALGTGATTVIFSAVDTVLLRPLPVAAPERLVSVRVEGEAGSVAGTVSYPFFQELRTAAARTADVAATHYAELTFRQGDGQAETVTAVDASANYFRVLGVRPALGRLFGEAEEPLGADPVAVLGHAFWRSRFGGDPGVLGRTVRLNGQTFTVIGVAPERLGGTIVGVTADVWVPLSAYGLLYPTAGPLMEERARHFWLMLFARPRAGLSAQAAEAGLDAAARGLEAEREGEKAVAGVRVERLTGVPPEARGAAVGFMALLLATAGMVLLIAATNVAGMLLARAASRRREIAIRLAMGAGRGRLVRQLLTESVLLFLLGGAGGTLLAFWATRLLGSFRPPVGIPVSLEFPVNLRVLAFALAVSLATGVAFGLAPALTASRPVLVPALKEGALSGRRSSRLRGAFVVGQLAMSLLLLISAGLFLRALQRALATDPGFRPEGVMVGGVDLGRHGYTDEAGRELQRRLLERVRAIPGVEAAGLTSLMPLSGNWVQTRLEVSGGADAGEGLAAGFASVDGGWFRAAGIPLVAGRTFTDADGPQAPGVVVVNRALARRLSPGGGQVLGRRFRVGRREVEVVGVVPDVKYQSLREEPTPFMYSPAWQEYGGSMTLAVRGQPAVMAAVRRELAALDPEVPLSAPMPMAAMTGASLIPQRIAAVLVGAFGVVGLVLSAVGVYGMLAYAVAQRTREIGVRMALGARRSSVLALVVRQGAVLIAAGVAVGVAAALAATRVLGGLLHGLSATDPVTFVAVPALVALAGLLASWLPALRATRVDPMVALRAD